MSERKRGHGIVDRGEVVPMAFEPIGCRAVAIKVALDDATHEFDWSHEQSKGLHELVELRLDLLWAQMITDRSR